MTLSLINDDCWVGEEDSLLEEVEGDMELEIDNLLLDEELMMDAREVSPTFSPPIMIPVDSEEEAIGGTSMLSMLLFLFGA